ncbi:hypothetical protein ACQEVZ_55210 [Dactylosporangium sp. CA-152071]|uniref:hypothetical protein n=1 Tax=Dactylosporangium sp. CA-152071 TaxID=3239933 RepID=UPI003D8E3C22
MTMRRLRLGAFTAGIDVEDGPVADFVHRITDAGSAGGPTHRVLVRRAGGARLVVDDDRRLITLTPPAGAVEHTVLIGVLQAVTRGVAYLERAAGSHALLHGSVFTVAGGAGVAVLDGGLGQGKTSLALALARDHGHLLVDEFAFTHTTRSDLLLSAAPTLPWHVRADMAPYTAPSLGATRLRYPDDLRDVAATAPHDAPLRLILIPDRGIPAGQVEPVGEAHARLLLRSAVTDHLAKLANPALDHVSIFTGVQDVVDPTGRPLAHQPLPAEGTGGVLRQLAAVPAYRVGIGAPADLPASVTAASAALATVTP